MHSLSALLKKRLTNRPFASRLTGAQVHTLVQAWILATWDQEVLSYLRTCYLRDGVLHVGVGSASFAEALQWKKEELLAHLRQSLPKKTNLKGAHIFVGG